MALHFLEVQQALEGSFFLLNLLNLAESLLVLLKAFEFRLDVVEGRLQYRLLIIGLGQCKLHFC